MDQNMNLLFNEQDTIRDFLDDCVAMVEALRCLREKGAGWIDAEGATLRPETFDKCFSGVEWEESDNGLFYKRAEYRGFKFDCLKMGDA